MGIIELSSCLNICYGPVTNYFHLHNFMGNPVNLSIMLKYLFRYLLKLLLLFLHLKQNDTMDHFNKRMV